MKFVTGTADIFSQTFFISSHIMKNIIAILFFFLFIKSAYPQNSRIDSLDLLINKTSSDTTRINLVNEKINILNGINIDSAISLGKKNIEEAEKINYSKGEANARLRLANSYCYKGEYATAAENLKVSENIFTSLKDSADLGKLYSGYGTMYGMQSKYDSAVLYFQKAIGIAQRMGDTRLLGTSYHNISISYYMQSNYSQALMYQQKALKFAEEQNDQVLQAKVTMNMGLTYKSMGDTGRAEQTLLKAVSFAKKSDIPNVELYAYSNLADLFIMENEFAKAYEYAIKAATLGGEMGDQGIQSASLSKAAIALSQQKKFLEAEKLGKQAIAIADSSNQPLNIYQVYSTMGSILKTEEKYKDAIPYFEKAFHAFRDADIFDEQMGEAYSDVSVCYEKTGDYRKALETYKISAKIVDSATSKENIRKATELTLNYEFEKKQQVAKAEQEKKDAVASAKQIALVVGLVLTLILALVAFTGYYNKRKANALLRKQKQEIQSTLTELKATQTQLIQSEKMASLGELTAGIAHEIQNPLNFVNNFSEVSVELAEELKDEINRVNLPSNYKDNLQLMIDDLVRNQQKINHHGKRADSIVKGMLQHSRTSTGQKEPTDINTLADEYLRLSYHGLRAKEKTFNATLLTDFDERIGKINIIPQDVGRVLLNLFTNAFYSVMEKKKQLGDNYEPTVSVCTKKLKGKIEIRVKDNGLGIPQKAMDKIFQPFFTTKPAGHGTGLGLSLSYEIITKGHNGEIKVRTFPDDEREGEGEGAEFIIQLPMKEIV
jgi:two-component system, NtrC family, sensor kinase